MILTIRQGATGMTISKACNPPDLSAIYVDSIPDNSSWTDMSVQTLSRLLYCKRLTSRLVPVAHGSVDLVRVP
jgi:hypothetical protein